MNLRAGLSASGVVVIAAIAGYAGMASGQQGPVAAVAAPSSPSQIKTVYHLTNGLEEASRGLGNIRNHLAADPGAKITVVTNGNGIEFLLDGAKDKNGNPYEIIVQDLKSKGVDFRVCNNTLVTRNIDKSRVIQEATIVPSGVAEAAKLQAREGYVYLRP